MQKQKPVYLDMPKIVQSLPIPGIVSILHRLSGVLLFVSLPLLLWLFAGTLGHQEAFAQYQAFVGNPLVKIALVLILWAYLHHMLAGVRFLFLDAHKGLELQTARTSAKVVAAAAPVLAVVIGAVLW